MQNAETTIKDFTTRVRQLILKLTELKNENATLHDAVVKRDKEIAGLKEEVKQQTDRYNALMMAKMINITDGDIEGSKRRINNLIRSVNKCISLLNGQEEKE